MSLDKFFIDIGMTFDYVYFKDVNGVTHYIETDNKENILFNQAEEESDNGLFPTDWEHIYMPMIKSIVKIYSGFAIQRNHFEAILFHDSFISFYDLQLKDWISHI